MFSSAVVLPRFASALIQFQKRRPMLPVAHVSRTGWTLDEIESMINILVSLPSTRESA